MTALKGVATGKTTQGKAGCASAQEPTLSKEQLLTALDTMRTENEQLRLAICGGEDAPGYAASLPLATVLDVAEQNIRAWFDQSDRATAAEAQAAALKARLEEALKALEPFADFGEFIATETEGFDDLDRLTVCLEESDVVLTYLSVGSFRRASEASTRDGGEG